MSETFLPIEEYLPHRGRMVLLDRVLAAEVGRIRCAVTLRPESPFCREGQVPAYVGIEYMAQATGALVGWHHREHGEAVKIGFLVSSRRYTSQVDAFRVGETLIVEAVENWRDEEGLGVMDCTIYHPEDVPVAKARLVAYQPKDLNAYLKTT
jgi:predicted hotdog family 3-hydroxylacyl-ACP dehydratase